MRLNQGILTPQQVTLLKLISASDLIDKLYLSGGTALVAFYLPYRYSDDLDFFSESEVDLGQVITWVKTNQKVIGYRSMDLRTSMNRNLFFLEFDKKYTLKLEFTYYPFPVIDNSHRYERLIVDSIEDIAVNKLFTIYMQPRYRDFTDLFQIISTRNLIIDELIKKAKIKFDWHVDKFQLAKRFMRVVSRHDTPQFVGNFDQTACAEFFLKEGKRLGMSIMR